MQGKMLLSATHQLRALRAKQHATRAVVEEHMAAYEAARYAYEAAERQEAELRVMLHTAEARTAQLLRDFYDAEAQLHNAATDLSHIQSLCHSLESRIAEHVRCQRSAVLLLVQPSSSTVPSSSPRLCQIDPYSLLHTPTGAAFTYDLVELSTCAVAGQAAGMYSDNEDHDASEPEGRSGTADAEAERNNDKGDDVVAEANALPTFPSSTSLLTDAVQDVLHGYHYTLFCTSADGCCLCCHNGNPTNKACAAIAPSISGVPAMTCRQLHKDRSTCQPANLCLRLLQLLQREAVRSGARALRITVAAGCVGGGEAAYIQRVGVTTTTAPASATARAAALCGWTDLLLPVAARHQQLTVTMEAVPSDEREEAGRLSMAADVESVQERSDSSVRASSWLDVTYTHYDRSRVLLQSTPSAAVANETPLITQVPTLEGVPVGSIEEAVFWLQEAGLLATSDTSKDPKDAATLGSSTATSTSHVDAQATTFASAVVVLLIGVDSKDAAGKLHSSLLRIVGDAHFDPGGFANATSLRKRGSRGEKSDAPVCCSPSSLALYMSHAMGAIARTAAARTPDAPGAELSIAPVNGERGSAASRCPAEMLLLQRAEVAPLAACEIRAVAHRISLHCPTEVRAIAAVTHGHAFPPLQLDAVWSLWAALLRPVFGGNSKALWLHCTSCGDCGGSRRDRGDGTSSHDPAEGVSTPDDPRTWPVPRDDTAALRLCALFCRLVRHDAVASKISPDLARLARVRP
ncbi:hypothetical protein, unknown function [Leishmania braziliensis MHOM/BR/75/M2904]|uniref:Uncharacterized protein n=2 Tax=Leishmania braziliensis TaxID=5660 RepID=A4H963_LEIBR|nr:hypothetical protein, unknown function [Leishmania braziliensis MHOM/BR/75/M2904]CAJ2470119.1 unnamed protein product [Leishmania braziliensis]CAM37932.2 hypothetical protein, unknown function [Leishmania braziliensis MHOM/BR/75/M2904]SYZ64592.1 hypothetical_protein [Leishmania braziliensis MHOM/BR/75/M2904]